MKKILTIWNKEFRGYLSGSGFYILFGIYMLFMSFSWIMLLKHFTEKSMRQMYMQHGGGGDLNLHREVIMGLIGNTNLILLFLIPFMTVRLLAEERKLKTFDLLLTSPITSAEIVVGKYLAALSVGWLLCLASIIYPLSIVKYTDIQWGVLFASYGGLMLIVAMYVAIGLFASSLSQSMILSGFIALIVSLGMWFMAWASSIVESPQWTIVIDHLSVVQHFSKFTEGTVQVSSIVFTLSVVAIFCFMSERIVESARWRA